MTEISNSTRINIQLVEAEICKRLSLIAEKMTVIEIVRKPSTAKVPVQMDAPDPIIMDEETNLDHLALEIERYIKQRVHAEGLQVTGELYNSIVVDRTGRRIVLKATFYFKYLFDKYSLLPSQEEIYDMEIMIQERDENQRKKDKAPNRTSR